MIQLLLLGGALLLWLAATKTVITQTIAISRHREVKGKPAILISMGIYAVGGAFVLAALVILPLLIG